METNEFHTSASPNISDEEVKHSEEAFATMLPISILWSCCGFIACINNSLLLYIFYRLFDSTNFYFMAVHLTVADLLGGIVCFYLGLERSYQALSQNVPWFQSLTVCSAQMSLLVFVIISSILQSFCLAFDRFSSVLKPVAYYKYVGFWFIQVLHGSAWASALAFALTGFLALAKPDEGNSHELFVCSIPSIFSKGFVHLFVALINAFSVLLVIFYTITIFAIRLRIKRARLPVRFGSALGDKHLNALVCLKAIVGLYSISWFLSTTALSVVTAVKFEIIIITVPYFWLLMNLSSACNFYIYLWKHAGIRREAKLILAKMLQFTAIGCLCRPGAWEPSSAIELVVQIGSKSWSIRRSRNGSSRHRIIEAVAELRKPDRRTLNWSEWSDKFMEANQANGETFMLCMSATESNIHNAQRLVVL